MASCYLRASTISDAKEYGADAAIGSSTKDSDDASAKGAATSIDDFSANGAATAKGGASCSLEASMVADSE